MPVLQSDYKAFIAALPVADDGNYMKAQAGDGSNAFELLGTAELDLGDQTIDSSGNITVVRHAATILK